jgi:putative sigma-54 modulation protein
MDIKLLAKNMDLTPAITDYVLKKVTKLGKYLSKIEKKGGEIKVNFEVSKNKRHKNGALFHADCEIRIDGKKFYFSTDKEDMYESIDFVKDGLFREISKVKDKKQTIARKEAKTVKKNMKK